jgi:hypothetical protein
MRTRLIVVLSALLLATSLIGPGNVSANVRRNVGVTFPAGAYGYSICPKYTYCRIDVVANDSSVIFRYSVKIYRYTNYATMSNWLVCNSDGVDDCHPTSYISCSYSGCDVVGWMAGSGGPGFPESVYVWNFENGEIVVNVNGTTHGTVKVDGSVVYQWYP